MQSSGGKCFTYKQRGRNENRVFGFLFFAESWEVWLVEEETVAGLSHDPKIADKETFSKSL